MIKVGILGTNFGKFHAELYKKIEGYEIVSIYGRDKDKLKKIGDELNINTTSDINEIIKNSEIDLLDICLPTELHSKWAIEGIKNNKHIFCETPLTYKVDEAEEIKSVSEKYNKNVFVNMFNKFSTPHLTAIKYAEEGYLGKLESIRSYNNTSPRWGDLGLQNNIKSFHIHNMDFVSEIIGVPENVKSNGIDFGGKSIVNSTFKVGNTFAILESNSNMPDCYPFSIGFELVFKDGVIWYDAKYGDYANEQFIVFKNNKQAEIVKLEAKDEYEEVFKEVLYCLNKNIKSKMLDINAEIKTVKIKNMILSSIMEK